MKKLLILLIASMAFSGCAPQSAPASTTSTQMPLTTQASTTQMPLTTQASTTQMPPTLAAAPASAPATSATVSAAQSAASVSPASQALATSAPVAPSTPPAFADLRVASSMELRYAEQFGVDYLSDGSALLTITGSGRFLIVPEGREPPAEVDADITVLRQPVKDIYIAATSAMCLFDALDALGNISMSGTQAEGWYIPSARAAMESGDIVYAGKYSAPDYELIMSRDCGLALESTMIAHAPEVAEKLGEIGVPVLMERSSYEPHPLGRTEWIKLYGLLVGKEALAAELFDAQATYLDSVSTESTGRTVAFFYISSAGSAVARRSGDYVTRMIELAGGEYAFSGLGEGESATGSVNLSMESFYAEAKDADVLIYNSSIDGELYTLDELVAKSHLLADFKAVQNGDVWCTGKNLFQETTGFGLLISDMHRIFAGEAGDGGDMNFLYKLRGDNSENK